MADTPAPDNSARIRINRFLARAGLGSRRECERLVTAGRVLLNGSLVTELSTTVDPVHDTVEYRGKAISQVRTMEYVAYHKPTGTLVSRRDPHHPETIYDTIRKAHGADLSHLRYVGRLDRNSEGLLLLTNDGDLVHALTHPRFHVKKVYHVVVDRQVGGEHIDTMVNQGIRSDGDTLSAGSVARLPKRNGYWYQVELYEGKNRQIRRMFDAFGYRIRRLIRVQFGAVRLGDLSCGAYRRLTEKEVGGLRNLGYKVEKGGGERKRARKR